MAIKKFEEFFESEGHDGPPEGDGDDLKQQFSHMGYDDDNCLIGCCKVCGANGVDVLAHVKECTGKHNEA